MQRLARLAIAAPRRVIAITVLAMVIGAVVAIPLITKLSSGGYVDPAAESSRAAKILSEEFHQGDLQLVITVSSDQGAQSDAARNIAAAVVDRLRRSPQVADVNSTWMAAPQGRSALISNDGKTGLIIAGITGGENDAQKYAESLAREVTQNRDNVTVRAGGIAVLYSQLASQAQRDLLITEAIAIPLSFLVLVWVFGGLVAATLPLLVSSFAILGSMAALRVIAAVTPVHIFALNTTVAMGFALAVDYTLLIISRLREELAAGAGQNDALVRTMATAGRTVLFSALIVGLSMSTMALFPMYALKSFAYAGITTVVFAVIAAVVVAPAALMMIGPRLDSINVRWLLRRFETRQRPVKETFWYRCCKFVMRHAIPISLAVVAFLLVLGVPFLSVKWGIADDRMLPPTASARQVGDQLRDDFQYNLANQITVVVPDITGVTSADLVNYSAALSQLPDVVSVSSPVGAFTNGAFSGPPNAPTSMSGGRAFLTVTSMAPLYTRASEGQLDHLHAVSGPARQPVLLTGTAQLNRDSVHAIVSHLPAVLGLIAALTFVALFLVTGSVVLPVKALAMNVLSLSAAFGALVWIFQEGHLGGLGTTLTGTLIANVPVLLFCVAFGLSMDYEVFLISRIREFWMASGQTRADNDESVALGVARTGRVVTAAALLMSISFAALIASQVSYMRMFGLGLTLAVLVDASLIRMLLVPAVMHLLGRVSWWAPRPMTWLHDRVGINESSYHGKHSVGHMQPVVVADGPEGAGP